MRPKSVVLEPWKKPQVHEKKFFRKKILAYLCRYDLQNGVRNFFLNKWVSRYLWFWKIALHNKIINKTRSKIPHTVLWTIISQIIMKNFCKTGLNPEKLELLEYALAITFFKENR